MTDVISVAKVCLGHVHIFRKIGVPGEWTLKLVHDTHCPEWCR